MKVQDILFDKVVKSNAELLKKLKEEIKKDEWMMCLGAGVSIAAGLPNWYGLLAKLTARLLPLEMQGLLTGKDKIYYDSLRNYCEKLNFDDEFLVKSEKAFEGKNKKIFNNINVLEAAEYIQNCLNPLVVASEDGENNRFNKEERKKIHWHLNHLIQEACEIEISIDSGNKELQESTLGAVAGLMKTEHDDLIHSVITYNYDNLLETYLRNISGCSPDKVYSIVKGNQLGDFGDRSGWYVYHVHGRIPVTDCEREPMSESVILTESDYYLEEQINYSWTNIVQSYAFVRCRLIFIGFSGADYNFRRIVKYVSQEGQKSKHRHYIFFLVDDIVEAVFEDALKNGKSVDDCIREMNESENSKYAFEKIFINYLIHAQTIYWKKYGMEVIWSSRNDLPKDLNGLH